MSVVRNLKAAWAYRQARRWVARRAAGPLSTGDQQQLDAWLRRSELNRQALRYQQDLWTSLDALAEQYSTAPVVVAAPVHRMPIAWSLAAGVLVTVLGAIAWIGLQQSGRWGAAVYATHTGEVRRVRLEDGTQVDLSPRTRLEVRFVAASREVVLREGEALFTVTRNPARPFTVQARGGLIRVLGTSFNVHEGPGGVTVSVLEGTVEVMREQQPEIPLRLVPGQEATYEDHGEIKRRAVTSMSHVGAWRVGLLEYRNETLERVVADANRYADGRLVIVDEQLKGLKLTAVFEAGDLPKLAQSLERILPVEAKVGRGGRIELVARDE
jgi:transmembrane sensor